MGYVLVPITKHRVQAHPENYTMWTIYKDERMLDSDLVFESESHDAAVKELTRLRLSCSNGVCED